MCVCVCVCVCVYWCLWTFELRILDSILDIKILCFITTLIMIDNISSYLGTKLAAGQRHYGVRSCPPWSTTDVEPNPQMLRC